MKKRARPLRTCIGCGDVDLQVNMIRVVFRTEKGLMLDERRREVGRGGYLHRRLECSRAFAGRKGMVRSLGVVLSRAQRAFVDELPSGDRSKE